VAANTRAMLSARPALCGSMPAQGAACLVQRAVKEVFVRHADTRPLSNGMWFLPPGIEYRLLGNVPSQLSTTTAGLVSRTGEGESPCLDLLLLNPCLSWLSLAAVLLVWNPLCVRPAGGALHRPVSVQRLG